MESWIQLADRRCPREIRDTDASVYVLVGRKKTDVDPSRKGTVHS